MTQFWIIATLLVVLAAAILFFPTLRRRKSGAQWSAVGILVAVATPLFAIGIYSAVTTWDPEATDRSSEEWAAVGRERFQAEDYFGARVAYIAAYERTPVPSNALKMSLAESLIITEPETLLGAAGMLVEEVLAAEPSNIRALFYGALAATQRGELANARERYSRMLGADLSPEIAQIVRTQIATLAAAEAGAGGAASAAAEDGGHPAAAGKTVRVRVRLAEGRSMPDLGPQALLFLSARPDANAAPVAVQRLPASAIPGEFVLSDADAIPGMAAMSGGRLSGLSEVLVTARLSSNGDARGQTGDLYAERTVQVGSDEIFELVLDRTQP